MTKDVFNDTNVFKQNFLGDKPTEYDLTVTNKSLTKAFFDPLTKFRFEPQKSKDITIIGVLAHQQFIKNIEQINLLNTVEQLFITDNTPANTTTDGTATNNQSSDNSGSNVAVTGINISQKTKTMDINTFSELVATLEPANATNQVIHWSTENDTIVKVDQQGALASKSVGKCVITATSDDGSFSATTTVTVRSRVQSINVTANDNKTTLVTGGDTVQLTASVSPATAEDKSVDWVSSDNSIATVDQFGLVQASSKTGYVDIIATANDGSGVSGKISLEVGAPS